MSFWEELKQAIIGAESPSTSYQMYDQKRKAEEKDLKQANNPAGKNIVIPAKYLKNSKPGLNDGNIVDDYIYNTYGEGIPYRSYLMRNTNVVVNPITGLSSGMARDVYDDTINDYTQSSRWSLNRSYDRYYHDPGTTFPHDYYYESLDPQFDASRTLSVNNVISPDVNNTPVAPQYKPQPEVQQEPTKESANNRRAAYNQARGITSAEAYKRQKTLRDAGYDIVYDGYWGDASNQAWNEYQKKLQQPQTPQMPAQFSNVDIMGAMKAEEARKKAELEALMQKQGAGSELLNTDPHNIKGGYVTTKEKPLDYSKLQTHTTDTNPFGFITADPLKDASKFYQKGGEVKEKETPTSFYSSGYFIDENGNPVTQETEMVKGNYNGKQYNIQRNIINTNGKSDTIMYNNNKRIPLENPDSAALYNEVFRDLLMRAQPVGEYKKGGSLKKCSCGCKTLLKRGKGGKVMESKNCK